MLTGRLCGLIWLVLLWLSLAAAGCGEDGETGLWIRIVSPKISIDYVLLNIHDPEQPAGDPLIQGEASLPEARTLDPATQDPDYQLWVLIFTDPKLTDRVRIYAVGFREEREVAYGELEEVVFAPGKIRDFDTFLELTHSGEDADQDGFYVPDDCDDTEAAINPEAREVCDGLDNNCNGTDDEGCDCTPGEERDCWPHWAPRPPEERWDEVPCEQGLQSCENGLWGSCLDSILPATEGSTVTCLTGGYECYRSCFDLVDNNCDGFLDEKDLGCGGCDPGESASCYTGPPETQNVGICHSGTWWCLDGSFGECTGEQLPLPGEICDGLDNDCDGETDDFLQEDKPSCSLRRGVCSGSKKSCELVDSNYAWVDCAPDDYETHIEETICLEECSYLNQQCLVECQYLCCCTQNCFQDHETTFFCDMLDNDCNSQLDDATDGDCGCTNGATLPCSTDVGECVQALTTCINGQWVDDAHCVHPSEELCDNLDNDCNGQIDNGTEPLVDCDESNPQPNASAFSCHQGNCEYRCDNGWLDIDPADLGVPGGNGCDYYCTETGLERCDGLDNDCDMLTDADDQVMTDILCPPRPNSTATTCTAPRLCDYTCQAPWDDCNMDLHVLIQLPGDDPPQTDGCESNLSYDENHCGVCGNRCEFSHADSECQNFACKITDCDFGWADCDTTVANGCEINTLLNLSHCGGCNQDCKLDHASEQCTAGLCRIDQCDSLWGNCDDSHASGCETPLDTLTDCGSCDDGCSRNHASATCAGGNCRIESCHTLYDNCDNIDWNGCETSLETLSDCGSCDADCSRDHANAICSGGNCRISSCNSLWENCDVTDWNGCETSLETLSDCGSCGTPCSRDHATPSCSGGSCHIGSCNTGWDSCDNIDSNGCEQDVSTDWQNCGGCDYVCNLDHVNQHGCSGGQCTIVSCDGGYRDCDGDPDNGCEVNINTDPSNCSQCNLACNLDHVNQHDCVNGNCTVISCDTGWLSCDGLHSSGCEQNIFNDPNNCSDCDFVCNLPNVNQHGCSNGTCTIISCIAPWVNCTGPLSNGCETNTQTDPLNCDGCGLACDLPQVDVHECINGGCTIFSCDPGWDDCNSNPQNGCEINIASDPLNCDQCGYVCNLPNVQVHGCQNGICTVTTCDPGFDDCTSGAGCETDVTSNESYCGSCTNSCGGGETCCGGNCADLQTDESYCGSCTNSCGGAEMCCGGGCIDPQTDEVYCGSCTNSCAGNETCCSGSCSFTQDDENNCGVCGVICEPNHASNICQGGACTPTCDPGWGNCDGNPNNGCETDLNADQTCGTSCSDLTDCTLTGDTCCGGGACCNP